MNGENYVMDPRSEVISNYFITVNTNESIDGMNAETLRLRVTSLKQAIQGLVIKKYIEHQVPGRTLSESEKRRKIKAIKVTFALEKGDIKNRLHAHLIVSILHKTVPGSNNGIRLDYASMRSDLARVMGRGMYFNAKMIYINSAVDYLKKTEVAANGKPVAARTVYKGLNAPANVLPSISNYDPSNPKPRAKPVPKPIPKLAPAKAAPVIAPAPKPQAKPQAKRAPRAPPQAPPAAPDPSIYARRSLRVAKIAPENVAVPKPRGKRGV